MKRKLALTATAFLALSAINLQLSIAFAQGTAFVYQGRLSVNGAPANGIYDWQFRLSSDPLGNSYVGTTYLTNGIGVSNGLFATTLDFGSRIFSGSNYWLEVDVRTNNGGSYTRLTPLQELAPAPYAIMANSASNLLGTLPARQLSGTILTGSLPASPTFSGTLTAGSFAGNGANVTNVNALVLNGLGSGALWQLGGNNAAGGQFLGTTNNQGLENSSRRPASVAPYDEFSRCSQYPWGRSSELHQSRRPGSCDRRRRHNEFFRLVLGQCCSRKLWEHRWGQRKLD